MTNEEIQSIVNNSQSPMSKFDLEVLLRTVQDREINTVMEIGTGRGYSAENWVKAFNPKLFFTIDISLAPEDAVQVDGGNYYYMWWNKSQAESTFHGVENLLDVKRIDFLFIDGDQHYDAVKKDWEMYSKLLAPDAVVVFTNINTDFDPNIEIWKLWHEISDGYKNIEIRGRDSHGTGVIIL